MGRTRGELGRPNKKKSQFLRLRFEQIFMGNHLPLTNMKRWFEHEKFRSAFQRDQEAIPKNHEQGSAILGGKAFVRHDF